MGWCVAIPITTAAMFAIGVVVQAVFLRPLRREDAAQLSLLVPSAVALLLEGAMSVIWKTDLRSVDTAYANKSWTVLGYQITLVGLAAFGLSVGLLAALHLILRRTAFGRAVRATVQNPA